MLDKTNKYPHIIALGLSHKEIIHYYIEVEKEIIDVNLFVLSKKLTFALCTYFNCLFFCSRSHLNTISSM